MIIIMLIIISVVVGLAIYTNWLIRSTEKDNDPDLPPGSIDDLKVLYALGKINQTDFLSMKSNLQKRITYAPVELKEAPHE